MANQATAGGPVLWHPTREYLERAHLTQFMRQHGLESFDELHKRSIEDIAWFTSAVLEYLGIRFSIPYSTVVDLSEGIAWPRWCVDGKLNIVETCLDRWIEEGFADAEALIWEAEDGRTQTLSYQALDEMVGRMANGLRSIGYGKGDHLAIYMPMIPEIVVALLAIAKIGAVALPLFSGYGETAIQTRLMDANATGLISADGFSRRGKLIAMKPTVDAALESLPNVRHVIIARNQGNPVQLNPGRDLWLDELIQDLPSRADTTQLDAEAPLMILYTSGTTGRPKGVLHTHCGFPVKAAQDMAFGTDVHRGDVIYWLTDMGWMMGPWLIFGALILGGTALLYDGAPDYPGPERTWALCADHSVRILGISPTLVRGLMVHGAELPNKYDLSKLRCFASTGEPWNPSPWLWLFKEVGKSSIPIINYSGGTEIAGGILMGNPITPLKACAFSAPCPGIWADVFDEDGSSLIGTVGELVIKAPWIGMTRGFLNDPERYVETYWSHWDDVWMHGDLALIDEEGSWFIHGRSDDTVKVAGKRVGPAEIESVLVAVDGVIEAAVIGIPDEVKGNRLIAFCVLEPTYQADEYFLDQLADQVGRSMGKPLIPGAIHIIPDLPKTRNAKVMRRVLRDVYMGQPSSDTSALVNPEVLEKLPRLAIDN